MRTNVKVQQEKSDAKLKTLHEDMVVKKAAPKVPPKKKGNAPKKAAPTASASTRPVRDKLKKMKV